jgi:hypothetical protein
VKEVAERHQVELPLRPERGLNRFALVEEPALSF